MIQKKAFPILVAVLVLLIAAIVLVVLFQDGTLKLGTRQTTVANDAVVQLVVTDGTVRHEPVDDFQTFVKAADKPVFVDFWAEWCPPCRLAAPFIEQLALEYDGRAIIVKVDVDQASDLARLYGAQSIPQFSVFVGGALSESIAGYAEFMQDDLRQMLDKNLS
jgi:thioredoxin 1